MPGSPGGTHYGTTTWDGLLIGSETPGPRRSEPWVARRCPLTGVGTRHPRAGRRWSVLEGWARVRWSPPTGAKWWGCPTAGTSTESGFTAPAFWHGTPPSCWESRTSPTQNG